MTAALDGKSAVLTGAGDIGSAIAAELVRHGARIRVWDLDEAALERVSSLGIETDRVDVCSSADVGVAAERALSALGGVDVLVTSAALLGELSPVASMAEDDWRRVLTST